MKDEYLRFVNAILIRYRQMKKCSCFYVFDKSKTAKIYFKLIKHKWLEIICIEKTEKGKLIHVRPTTFMLNLKK